MDTLEKYRLEKKHLNAQLKEFGQDLFKPFFTSLFEKYTEAQRVRWTQYAPHFNDGDACVFTVHEASATRHTDVVVAVDGDEDEDETWVDSWEAKDEPHLAACAHEVNEFFSGIEDAMETAFGDGVQVTVDRSGEITVSDYDHD